MYSVHLVDACCHCKEIYYYYFFTILPLVLHCQGASLFQFAL